MAPPSLYEKVDRFLARQLGPLDKRVEVLIRGGVGKDTASSIAEAQLISRFTANAGFLGIKPGTPEYEYAVTKASTIAVGVVDWQYDPDHIMPPVVVESFEKSKHLGVASKSISVKAGRWLGVGVRRAGEFAERIGEYV